MVTMDIIGGDAPSKVIEGKTKFLMKVQGEPDMADVHSKWDITAGDGAKHDVFEGKAEYATTTTCNVFELLKQCGIPLAYERKTGPTSFRTKLCKMLPYEVVARRVALGSYLKRNPHVRKGERFDSLVIEFYLKTSGKNFRGIEMQKDDPLIVYYGPDGVTVRRPDEPQNDKPGVYVEGKTLYGEDNDVTHPFREMEALARRVFLVLEHAWAKKVSTLCDLKIEFGYTTATEYAKEELVVADVVDNDSWRLLDHLGQHLDKQRYRDGGDLSEIAKLYREVAQMTEDFPYIVRIPHIILWRGSEKDDVTAFERELERLGKPAKMTLITCSVHKATKKALRTLAENLDRNGLGQDTVIIAYVGLSNGAGPTLQGNTHVPVFSVPVDEQDFMSSFRMPSDIPMGIIRKPAEAIQMALQVFSANSAHCYMARKYVQENWQLEEDCSPTLGKKF